MKKILTVFLTTILVLVIVLSSSFIFFFTVFNTKTFPSLNQRYRDQFAKYDFFKKIFRLNQIGDAKSDLLTISQPDLDIIIVKTGGFSLIGDANEYLKDQIGSVSKAAKVSVKEIEREEITDFSDKNLEKISKEIIKSVGVKNPVLIILLDKMPDYPTRVGLAINDRTILIFKGRINELSETESIKKEIERSTILHEFGHLIGLEHNKVEGCLMNELVESPGNQVTVQLPQKFCQLEEDQIEKIRENIN